MIEALDLGQYYRRRTIDPDVRPLRPDEDQPEIVFEPHVRDAGKGLSEIHLLVDGLHCAACVWLIEQVLARVSGVVWARVNMTTRRLVIRWRAGEANAEDLAARVAQLGYRLVPFDPAALAAATDAESRRLLKAMAVAGFAAANIMLLSVAVWAGAVQDMGPATRALMHWISGAIALPAVAYAGRPFFGSALTALRGRRLNMDVPISLAVILAAGMSLFETIQNGDHVYFDSAAALLFFLLIGRYLDSRARGKARSSAERLLAIGATPVTILMPDGKTRQVMPAEAVPGTMALIAPGERIPVDGKVRSGRGDVDTSLIDGESLPKRVGPGDTVYAGAVNLTSSLNVAITAGGEDTLLAEIARLMENAEQDRAGYVLRADRIARLYAPIVHLLGLATFVGWITLGGAAWQEALLYAIAVLIITCPCALALAIPAVHVVASGRLFAGGVLVKSGGALERLAKVDTVVFDKTGTLTEGRLELADADSIAPEDLRFAAAMAMTSRHPLARALVRAAPLAAVAEGVVDVPGCGLTRQIAGGEARLGSRAFCGVAHGPDDGLPEMWLVRPRKAPVRFAFVDRPRRDAASVIESLSGAGYRLCLLSGDRPDVVGPLADDLGIADWRAGVRPDEKLAEITACRRDGRVVLMVGDGLNDAPALTAADVSAAPADAADISQTASDFVFQGRMLSPVVAMIETARRADRLVKQNLAFAFLYNAITIPVAMSGFASPLVAAVAMSTSSLIVVANALRLGLKAN